MVKKAGELMLQNKLKEIRMKEYMLNKKEFADFLGIAHAQYRRYESSLSSPSLEIALQMSKKLNKNVSDIWTEDFI